MKLWEARIWNFLLLSKCHLVKTTRRQASNIREIMAYCEVQNECFISNVLCWYWYQANSHEFFSSQVFTYCLRILICSPIEIAYLGCTIVCTYDTIRYRVCARWESLWNIPLISIYHYCNLSISFSWDNFYTSTMLLNIKIYNICIFRVVKGNLNMIVKIIRIQQ